MGEFSPSRVGETSARQDLLCCLLLFLRFARQRSLVRPQLRRIIVDVFELSAKIL